jgi:hypothetical protein
MSASGTPQTISTPNQILLFIEFVGRTTPVTSRIALARISRILQVTCRFTREYAPFSTGGRAGDATLEKINMTRPKTVAR